MKNKEPLKLIAITSIGWVLLILASINYYLTMDRKTMQDDLIQCQNYQEAIMKQAENTRIIIDMELEE